MTKHAPANGPRPLSTPTALSFSTLAFPLGALAVAVSVYIPPFFASHLGVNLTSIGVAFFVVRMLDMGVDPVLGLVMDRTRTRWGRYRVWVLIGGPILMAAVYALSWWKTWRGLAGQPMAARQAALLTLAKIPNLLGMLTYHRRRRKGEDMRIIEYK